jgi:hypothetical protein
MITEIDIVFESLFIYSSLGFKRMLISQGNSPVNVFIKDEIQVWLVLVQIFNAILLRFYRRLRILVIHKNCQ